MAADSEKEDRWIVRHYASRRGFVRTYWHRLLYYLGAYRQYKDVDWQSVERLVFVCKGNICRSAYAEAVARSLGIDAISCGLDTIENSPANTDAIQMAEIFGADLKQHKTLPVMYVELRKTDLLVAVEPWHISFLKSNLKRDHQYSLLGLWVTPVLPHLQDPYGAPHTYFDQCFSSIQKAVRSLSIKLKK